MTDQQPARRYRFGTFEADAVTGELRRKGILIRLNGQPFQLLLMLLERPGQLLTRDEISRELWPDGTVVDYEHGVNSAMNRIREALGDSAGNSRFVQTLARRGYRFIAPVERLTSASDAPPEPDKAIAAQTPTLQTPILGGQTPSPIYERAESKFFSNILASSDDLPRASYPVVQTLFVLMQAMYLAFYVGALANLTEIGDLLSPLQRAADAIIVIVVTAAILIPVRTFLVCAALFRAPGLPNKFLRLWPFLLVLDVLWSLSPFLLLHHINFGLALASTTLLVYSPFAQRSLVLMGAGGQAAAKS